MLTSDIKHANFSTCQILKGGKCTYLRKENGIILVYSCRRDPCDKSVPFSYSERREAEYQRQPSASTIFQSQGKFFFVSFTLQSTELRPKILSKS